jgi:hypothetical protein
VSCRLIGQLRLAARRCHSSCHFDLDVLACPRCGGPLGLIATIEDPEAIRAMLAALAGSREREGRLPPGAAGERTAPR